MNYGSYRSAVLRMRRADSQRVETSRLEHHEPTKQVGTTEPEPNDQREPEEASDLDEFDGPTVDDADWEAFIADDDERDPQPAPGDFWMGWDREQANGAA